MKTSRLSQLFFLALVGAFVVITPPKTTSAQGTTSESVNSSGILGQLSASFSGGQVVQSVQLSGNATWYVGSLVDSGTVSLTASTSGSAQMQVALGATG